MAAPSESLVIIRLGFFFPLPVDPVECHLSCGKFSSVGASLICDGSLRPRGGKGKIRKELKFSLVAGMARWHLCHPPSPPCPRYREEQCFNHVPTLPRDTPRLPFIFDSTSYYISFVPTFLLSVFDYALGLYVAAFREGVQLRCVALYYCLLGEWRVSQGLVGLVSYLPSQSLPLGVESLFLGSSSLSYVL